MFAAAALAAESWSVDLPSESNYTVSAVLIPGAEGAEVCGVDRGQEHVNFSIGFGAGLGLSVNGVDAGSFDPTATYSITVACHKIGCHWFATTHIVNQSTGEPVFEQMNYKMPGAADQAHAIAEDVTQLQVQ
jgi:hypothetical protein